MNIMVYQHLLYILLLLTRIRISGKTKKAVKITAFVLATPISIRFGYLSLT